MSLSQTVEYMLRAGPFSASTICRLISKYTAHSPTIKEVKAQLRQLLIAGRAVVTPAGWDRRSIDRPQRTIRGHLLELLESVPLSVVELTLAVSNRVGRRIPSDSIRTAISNLRADGHPIQSIGRKPTLYQRTQ